MHGTFSAKCTRGAGQIAWADGGRKSGSAGSTNLEFVMWTSPLWQHDLVWFQWGVVILACLLAAAWDLRSRRIPNLLTFPLLATGLVWATWIGGLAGLAEACGACLLLGLPYVILFFFAGGGAGDAKLMGALGTWLGIANGAIVLLVVALTGAAMALVFAAAKHRLSAVLSNVARTAGHLLGAMGTVYVRRRVRGVVAPLPKIENMQTMPYGIGIFFGVCLAAGGVLAWRI